MNDYILEPSDYAPDPDAVAVSIECRRDTEAETVTDYDSGDVGGTQPHKVRTNNVRILTESEPCLTCGGAGADSRPRLGYYWPCPTCHGTGVKA